MNCHACGTPLSETARFCHKCGAAIGAPSQPAAWRIGLPWGIAGAAVGALLTVLAMRTGGAAGGPPFPSEAAPPRGMSASDISRMSPEEQARRLFDRVMRLAEEGKQDSVAFFVPMALQVYQQLPALDNDAHYDIGVLQLAAGNAAGALAEAETLRRAVPTHLYAFLLKARALELQADVAGARRAYADFLRNETAERARQRPEYDAHASTLDAFHTEAVNKTRTGT
jgi:zinc ribbon protein